MVFIERLYRLEIRLLLWCGKSRHYPKLLHLISAVSHSGDGYVQVILPLLLWLLEPTQGEAIGQHCLMAFALERLLYLVLKPTLKRRRPPEALPSFSSAIQASDKFSFPSGHSMASFCLATILCLHYGSYAEPLFVWAVAVAIARVLLGVHFPSDVVAGAVLGVCIAILTF